MNVCWLWKRKNYLEALINWNVNIFRRVLCLSWMQRSCWWPQRIQSQCTQDTLQFLFSLIFEVIFLSITRSFVWNITKVVIPNIILVFFVLLIMSRNSSVKKLWRSNCQTSQRNGKRAIKVNSHLNCMFLNNL